MLVLGQPPGDIRKGARANRTHPLGGLNRPQNSDILVNLTFYHFLQIIKLKVVLLGGRSATVGKAEKKKKKTRIILHDTDERNAVEQNDYSRDEGSYLLLILLEGPLFSN